MVRVTLIHPTWSDEPITERRRQWQHLDTQRPTFVHRHPAVVTLDDLVGVLAVVSQADAADEDVLRAPGLGPVQQGILGHGETEAQQSHLAASRVVLLRSEHRSVHTVLTDTVLRPWEQRHDPAITPIPNAKMFIIQCPILWYAKVCALPSARSSCCLYYRAPDKQSRQCANSTAAVTGPGQWRLHLLQCSAELLSISTKSVGPPPEQVQIFQQNP